MRLGWTVLARSSRFVDDHDHDNDRDNDDDDNDDDVGLDKEEWNLGEDDHHDNGHDDDGDDVDDDDNNDVGLCKVEWIVIGSSFHTLSLPNVLARYPEVAEIVLRCVKFEEQ